MKKLFVTLAIAGLSVLPAAHATLVREKFTTNPALDGWQVFGATNLFHWDSTNQNLAVTWNSRRRTAIFIIRSARTFTTE